MDIIFFAKKSLGTNNKVLFDPSVLCVMGKSLGDYNINKSSSSDTKNIQWSYKKPTDTKKTGKKHQNTSSTNIIYTEDVEKDKPDTEKIIKVKNKIDENKNKNNSTDKKHQTSSITNCNIEQGYKRKAR